MLVMSGRPWVLINRILSKTGHLSNEDSAKLFSELVGEKTKSLVLFHLSSECNTKDLALLAYKSYFKEAKSTIQNTKITVSDKKKPTEFIEVYNMKEISLLNLIKTKRAISSSINISYKDVKFDSSIFGGMSNKTYLFKTPDKKYAVHISTKGYNLFLKRETELDCLDKLKERINASQEFPHEIGLFIGYPIEDVKGFIEKGANGSKYCGAWRVYGDVDAAKKKFAIYKKCRDVYCSIYKKNNNFGKLIISK